MPAPDASDEKRASDEDEPVEPAERNDGGPLGKGLDWKTQRAEIAEEPGNHGRFAFGCSVAVAVVLVAFFVIRMFVMR